MEYQLHEWIRAYTTSLRGAGASTNIGKIVSIRRSKEGETILYRCQNATGGFECYPCDIVEKLDVDELQKRLGI